MFQNIDNEKDYENFIDLARKNKTNKEETIKSALNFLSAKSKVTIVFCKNSENCEAFKKDLCINFCPYSKTVKEAGFTAKSLSNRKWITKYKEMFKSIMNRICQKGIFSRYNERA